MLTATARTRLLMKQAGSQPYPLHGQGITPPPIEEKLLK